MSPMIRHLPWLLLVLSSCARPDAHESGAPAASVPASVPAVASVAPSGPSAAAPAVASVVVPVVEAGPPRQVVQGDGITITETSGGEVVLKTSSLWNEPIDTTYASCDYYKGALPVLKRQLREDRAKLLPTICGAKK